MSESTAEVTALPAFGPLVARIVFGLLLLVAGTLFIGNVFHDELEDFGRTFVERFGLGGMALGTLIADGLHFPVPPQFYMLMGITSGVSGWVTLLCVNAGSFAGGWLAYFLARHVTRWKALERRLEGPRKLLAAVMTRYGSWALVVASFLPITYAGLCYLCGASRLPARGFAVITLIRIPRLVAYYYLVLLGWRGI